MPSRPDQLRKARQLPSSDQLEASLEAWFHRALHDADRNDRATCVQEILQARVEGRFLAHYNYSGNDQPDLLGMQTSPWQFPKKASVKAESIVEFGYWLSVSPALGYYGVIKDRTRDQIDGVLASHLDESTKLKLLGLLEITLDRYVDAARGEPSEANVRRQLANEILEEMVRPAAREALRPGADLL